jgi:NAD(P)-dependent dehydrogenase (short-subunit alcohol dehydrogenase family)
MERVAAVTGAANGIGRAVAERLVADGYTVAGLDIEEVTSEGLTPFYCDVAAVAGHEQLITDIEDRLGPLDALVNVAGISIPQPLAELDLATYQRHLDVMVTGPVFLARAAGLRMAARGSGRIVNVTSIHGTHSEAGCVAYDVAKGGLEAGTRTLAIELGRSGVLVNSVAPGFVNTRMSIVDGKSELETDYFREIYQKHGKIALARASEPAEIAAAVAHLVSPDNTYITGARLLVDGGLAVTF